MAEMQAVLERVAAREPLLRDLSRSLFEHPETIFEEHYAAALLSRTLTDAGFAVQPVAGLPTAFVALWRSPAGAGARIAYLPEYDALPELSQKPAPQREEVWPGAPGHGCHHHYLGPCQVVAALALQEWLLAQQLSGEIAVYGCPAEEGGSGKAEMLNAGAFAPADCYISWHPSSKCCTYFESRAWACIVGSVTFFSRQPLCDSEQTGGGRSSLDAAELFSHGLSVMCRTLPPGRKVYAYSVESGPQPPIPLPSRSQIRFRINVPTVKEGMEEILPQVEAVARGADQMSWRNFWGPASAQWQPPRLRLERVRYECRHNESGMKALAAIIEALGVPPWSEQDRAQIAAVQRAFGLPEKALPSAPDREPHSGFPTGGGTDVGDVSWNFPTVQFWGPTVAPNIPLHTPAAVALGGMQASFTAALHASRVLALFGARLLTDAELRRAIAAEFANQQKADYWQYYPGTERLLG